MSLPRELIVTADMPGVAVVTGAASGKFSQHTRLDAHHSGVTDEDRQEWVEQSHMLWFEQVAKA